MVVILNRLTMVNLIGKVIFKALFDYAKAFDCVDPPFQYSWASLVAQPVKNLPAMRKTWV